jgi:3-dehydroquinate synthase
MLPDNILFSRDPANDLMAFLDSKKYSKIVVLVDENTRTHCYPPLAQRLGNPVLVEVKSGEESKNLETCQLIWQALTDHTLDRHACALILGGGVLGDMGGFCAATYKRGIDFILIPTTLLAQVDASIGGKLGVDFNNFKNHIGVFKQPALTLLCPEFLSTLPPAELRSGFAEVIKHCLIADQTMWQEISGRSLADQNWDKLIRHSVEFKARITTEDPTEKGLRKILNAGHTIGHAVESHLLNSGNRVLHGEAIAVGLITEGFISRKRDLLTESAFHSIYTFILKMYDKVNFTRNDLDAIAGLILQDKKNRDNRVLCVLLEDIGTCRWDCEISLEEVKDALSFYLTL